MDLAGSVAIVTGAGQGIGEGIARVLAKYGAKLVLTDLDGAKAEAAADALRSMGGDALATQQDVADTASMKRIIDRTISHFGTFDILVNNAAIATQQPFDEITEVQWDKVNAVNQRGLFFAAQAAGRHFKRQQSGKILNISSFSGKQAVEEYLIYNATKAATIMMTQTLALELGPYNVNVNAICPGIVKTPIWDNLDPAVWDRNEQRIPLRRGQTTEDIGEAAAFLVSEQSRNITGAVLAVTGGLAMF